jgi:PAS domain-containing protein
MRGETVKEEFIIRREDHKDRQVLAHAAPILGEDGDIMAGIVVFLDITEQTSLEKELAEEKEMIEHVMNVSPSAITIVDRTGRVTYANKMAETILGIRLSVSDGITYDSSDWRITDFDGNPFPQDQLPFNLVRTRREPVFDVRHAISWPDGTRVLLSINAEPLLDENQRFDGMVCGLADIESENAIIKANHDLRERVKELNCLQQLAHLVAAYGRIEPILSELVFIIAQSWQYPEHTAARILYMDTAYVTDNFQETSLLQTADIIVQNGKAGRIDVFYIGPVTETDYDPFLEAEAQLLDAIALRLGRVIERLQLTRRYKDLFNTVNEAIVFGRYGWKNQGSQPGGSGSLRVSSAGRPYRNSYGEFLHGPPNSTGHPGKIDARRRYVS